MSDLLDQLRSPDATQRLIAAIALDDVASTSEIEDALRVASRDPDARVRRAAMHALACSHCKPDRCIGPAAVEILIDGLLNDPSIRNRRWCAGITMFDQVGSSEALVAAFRSVIATTDDRVLRERAASFLALREHPRDGKTHREWFPAWSARKKELLAS